MSHNGQVFRFCFHVTIEQIWMMLIQQLLSRKVVRMKTNFGEVLLQSTGAVETGEHQCSFSGFDVKNPDRIFAGTFDALKGEGELTLIPQIPIVSPDLLRLLYQAKKGVKGTLHA